MHLSRLLRVSLILGIAAAATVIACGSSGTKNPDAKVFLDGKVFMDAPAGANGIGTICTSGSMMGSDGLCPSADPICTSLTGNAWFCTASCGTGPCAPGGTAGSANCFCNGSGCPSNGSAGAYAQPPSGGDAICMAMTSTGTPACVLGATNTGGSAGSAIAWACGILCGSAGSANLGMCPTGLTCSGNICQ